MLDPSANRQPLTSRVRHAIIAAVMGLVLPVVRTEGFHAE